MERANAQLTRRGFLTRLGAGSVAIGVGLAGCEAARPAQASPAVSAAAATAAAQAPVAAGATQPKLIRLSSVVVPQQSGLLDALLPDFEKRAGYKVEITTAQDVYGPAREGKFDAVLSHYQHEGVSAFVQDGFGDWPRPIFYSPGAIIGPPSDPAAVRGLELIEAFRRITRSAAPFIVNDIDGLKYVADVAARSAGASTSAGWYVDKQTKGPDAMKAAVQSGGYSMWGLIPFLRMQQQGRLPLEALVTRDQLLQSVMVIIPVKGQKLGGINTAGAQSLQQYLLEPETQAKIRTFRMTGAADPVWWPAAQDNEKAVFAR